VGTAGCQGGVLIQEMLNFRLGQYRAHKPLSRAHFAVHFISSFHYYQLYYGTIGVIEVTGLKIEWKNLRVNTGE
jgi:hypothetical protein